MGICNRDESFRERTYKNLVNFGQFIMDHAGDYADAICAAPCADYSISLDNNLGGDPASISLRIEHVDKDIH